MTTAPVLAPSPRRPAGRGDDVALFTCDLDTGGAVLAADWALLAPAERDRADRFRFDRDRDRYTRGRAFLRRRLAAATGRPAATLNLIEGAWGKPALRGHAVAFNLSHSGSLAVLALSSGGRAVGIDVERIDRRVDLWGLARSCFLPSERAVLDALAPAARTRRFFAFWTAKEAVMKLTGQGMSRPPLEIALRLDGGWPTGCLQPDLAGVELSYPDLDWTDAICCLAVFGASAPGPGLEGDTS